jgi:PAS domain S-box-containing protein
MTAPSSTPTPPAWAGPSGGGQMGERIRALDWSRTALGPLAGWPLPLRLALQLCLETRFPIHLWWGPERVNLYNDAFISILGRRHPAALGVPARSVWPEIWNLVGQEAAAVLERGESSWNERRHVVVDRNGFSEEAWFTWSYSPIRGETGEVLGLMCVTIDDTPRVLAEKSREHLSNERMRQEADERARGILESIGDAFFSLDPEWRFTYVNPQSLVLLGRPPAELIGKSLWTEYPGLIGSPFEPIYRGAAERREPASIVSYFPDHKRWYDVRVYPAVHGLSVYFRDVSERKAAEEEREQLLASEKFARGEAERASRVKDEFLATLSHELRTPLNAVLGWCEVLITGDLANTADVASGLRTIERNAHAQAQIISDILDMSGIMAGKVRLSMRPMDLEGAVREALETVRPAAEGKGIALELAVSFAPSHILGDPARLQQVFWNLLSNAVKFTPKGGRITARLGQVDSHLEVAIADTGMGIPAEFLPHVFDRFRQADASTTRQFGGLGLGLSIVKQLVELHGGTVVAESAGAGRGTVFTVSLPLNATRADLPPPVERRAAPGRPALADGAVTSGGIEGVRILVVDDEPDARALLKRLLEDRGARVATAGSAAEALAAVAAAPPDLLISDVGMPGEDGYSLIRRIRAFAPEKGGRVPAIALTAYARVEDRVRAIGAGFQQHLSKPVSPAELIAMVASLTPR